MSTEYFSRHDYISNSTLKRIVKSALPENIDRIFEFGSLVHACIFEPHKANTHDPDYALAQHMKETFYKDWLCKSIMSYRNIKPEHEFYRKLDGLKRRCKADASIRDCKLIVEFKGLSITNEKSFREAITHFDYDMGAAWYLDTTGFERELIIAVSKTKPDKLFRFMIEKGDPLYKQGRRKYIDAISKGVMSGQINQQHITNAELLQNLIDENYVTAGSITCDS